MCVCGCRFHEKVSRFIVIKIIKKTGFLLPLHARMVCTYDNVPEKKTERETGVSDINIISHIILLSKKF